MGAFWGPPDTQQPACCTPQGSIPQLFGAVSGNFGARFTLPLIFLGGQDLLQPGAGAREAPGERLGEKQFLRMLDIIKC